MKLDITSTEYELLVRDLVGNLSYATNELKIGVVAGGRLNLISGQSGFAHQIDVSLTLPDDLVLVECKYWKEPVGAEAVLTLAARKHDIQQALPSITVYASTVSTQRATAGAKTLCDYFKINLDIVESDEEYLITLVKRHFAGVADRVVISDCAIAEVVRRPE